MSKKNKMWWVSWVERNELKDSRPLHDPPWSGVLAWWETGTEGVDGDPIVVALLAAPTLADLEDVLRRDWPAEKGREWRFRDELGTNVVKLSDRFPLKKWNKERIAKAGFSFELMD